MSSGDPDGDTSPPALLAQTWQATPILEIIGGLVLRRELRDAVMSLT
jgi:hypothetical protein